MARSAVSLKAGLLRRRTSSSSEAVTPCLRLGHLLNVPGAPKLVIVNLSEKFIFGDVFRKRDASQEVFLGTKTLRQAAEGEGECRSLPQRSQIN
jgi:hypothetical protein